MKLCRHVKVGLDSIWKVEYLPDIRKRAAPLHLRMPRRWVRTREQVPMFEYFLRSAQHYALCAMKVKEHVANCVEVISVANPTRRKPQLCLLCQASFRAAVGADSLCQIINSNAEWLS